MQFAWFRLSSDGMQSRWEVVGRPPEPPKRALSEAHHAECRRRNQGGSGLVGMPMVPVIAFQVSKRWCLSVRCSAAVSM